MPINYNGVPVSGSIVPTSDTDTYPITYPTLQYGGYMVVQTLADRNAIPEPRKENGMHVYVADEDKTYILKNNAWEVAASSAATQAGIEGAMLNGNDVTITDKKLVITLDKNSVGLDQVDNTSDLNKPLSTATQTALDLKVNITDYNTKQTEQDTKISALEGKVTNLENNNTGGGTTGNPPDLSDYYNKTVIDGKLDQKANTTDVYTRTEVDNVIATIPKVDLTQYYTKTETNTELAKKYGEQETTDKIESKLKELGILKHVTGTLYPLDTVVYQIVADAAILYKALKENTAALTDTTAWKPIPVDGTGGVDVSHFVTDNTPQDITAKKTYTVLPETNVVPTTDNQLVNFKFVNDTFAKKADLTQAIHFRGVLANHSDLTALTNMAAGDMYIVQAPTEKQGSYIYNGTIWEYAGKEIIDRQAIVDALPFNIKADGTIYYTKAEYDALTANEKSNGRMYIIMG